jgi:gliding motility-associated-like protein
VTVSIGVRTLSLVSGNNQTGPVNQALAAGPIFKVLDANGAPAANIPLTVTASAGQVNLPILSNTAVNFTPGGFELKSSEWKAFLFTTRNSIIVSDKVSIVLNSIDGLYGSTPPSIQVEAALYTVVNGFPSVEVGTSGLQSFVLQGARTWATLNFSTPIELNPATSYALVLKSNSIGVKWANVDPGQAPQSDLINFSTAIVTVNGGTSWSNSGVNNAFILSETANFASTKTISTNSNGTAALGSWVLGDRAGTQQLLVTNGNLLGSPLTITATATAVVPFAPTGLSYSPGNGQVTLAFTPGYDGGSVVTNYEYSLDNGSSWNALNPVDTSSPVTITGLTNGVTYPVKIRAVNVAGQGAASAAISVNSVIPLTNQSITVDPIANQTYTGSAITPTAVVKDGNTMLTLGTDYTVAYTSNTNVGMATVTITGNGNYSGTKTQTFTIVAKAASTLTIDAIANQTYTGAAITPAVVVKDGNTTLSLGTDYTVAYTSNTNVGTATVTITGTGNFTGTKTQTFGIVAKAASTLTIEAIANQSYTGSAISPAVVVKDGTTTLTLGTDYTVAYTSNTNVGTATVTITGTGNYTGTKTQTFTIVAKAASTLTIDAIANQTYTGSAITPTAVVKDGNTTLTLGTDYTIAYTSNTNVGMATVTITGTGNYSGTKTQTFTIVAKAASTLTIEAIANQSYTGSAISPAVVVKDGTTTLTLGTDYTVAYSSNTNVGTATVTITGTGNYTGTKNQTFTIVAKTASMLTIEPIANQTYTGSALAPAVVVKDGSTTLTLGTDYAVAYSNNTNAGTGSLLITGLGVYSGTQSLSFVIQKSPLTVRIGNASKNYGQADPAYTVSYSGFLANQTAAVLSGTLTFSRATGQNPGNYAVTASGLTSANYSFNYISGTLTIVTVDTDGDGVPDHVEEQDGTDPSDASDAKDSDGDGVPDYVEAQDGTDPNDASDAKDSDGDGVPDYVETQDGTDPSDPRDFKDSDGDGVPDFVEIQDGTDPNDPKDFKDSDGDGVPDFVEVQQGTDPRDPTDFKDTDGDGVPDFVEVQQGTNPNNSSDATDSDGDGVPDYIEIREGTDPNNPQGAKDTDGDGVPDFVENQQGTDPSNPRSFKDSDGGGVPDYVETVVYPRLGLSLTNPANSIDDFSDRDGDGVSDYQEYLDGTDPKDPGAYKDSDGDGVPDQVEIKEGSNPNSANSFKDSDGDGVADYIQIRSFREGTPEDLVILWGDINFASKLSNRVLMRTSQNELVSVQVTWDDLSGVKPLARGTYLAKGTIVVPKGYFNPYQIKGLERVIVLPKPAPLDVTLNNNSFVGSTSTYFIPVGAFVVNDPVDKVHVVSLNGPGYDNRYFVILNNTLYWNSADLAAGKTTFSIIVRVTDRDGNTLDKFFEISRTRPSITSLEVANTFSPNGDRINDTWGIAGARFYSGTTLQVYDRGGTRVFYTEDPSQRWDGTYSGKELPTGTYYWTLEVAETGEIRRGVLNVLKK